MRTGLLLVFVCVLLGIPRVSGAVEYANGELVEQNSVSCFLSRFKLVKQEEEPVSSKFSIAIGSGIYRMHGFYFDGPLARHPSGLTGYSILAELMYHLNERWGVGFHAAWDEAWGEGPVMRESDVRMFARLRKKYGVDGSIVGTMHWKVVEVAARVQWGFTFLYGELGLTLDAGIGLLRNQFRGRVAIIDLRTLSQIYGSAANDNTTEVAPLIALGLFGRINLPHNFFLEPAASIGTLGSVYSVQVGRRGNFFGLL